MPEADDLPTVPVHRFSGYRDPAGRVWVLPRVPPEFSGYCSEQFRSDVLGKDFCYGPLQFGKQINPHAPALAEHCRKARVLFGFALDVPSGDLWGHLKVSLQALRTIKQDLAPVVCVIPESNVSHASVLAESLRQEFGNCLICCDVEQLQSWMLAYPLWVPMLDDKPQRVPEDFRSLWAIRELPNNHLFARALPLFSKKGP